MLVNWVQRYFFCPYVIPGREVKSTVNDEKVKIKHASDFQTKNLVYCVTCDKCKKQYIGETERSLNARFKEHLGYVRNKKSKEPTGFHFNFPGHDVSMMKITVLEKIWKNSTPLRKARESMYIRKFESQYQGINRKD